jgi:hypothetical protein
MMTIQEFWYKKQELSDILVQINDDLEHKVSMLLSGPSNFLNTSFFGEFTKEASLKLFSVTKMADLDFKKNLALN